MISNYRYIYPFETYCTEFRFMTYYQQIKCCLGYKPKSVLVIGPGDHIVPVILKHINPNITVDTFDIKEGSTYLGDLRSIKDIVNTKYDCILCCEVLEHIEFEYFDSIKDQLLELCNEGLIISVPKFTGTMCKYHKWEVGAGVSKITLIKAFSGLSLEEFEVNDKILFICVMK